MNHDAARRNGTVYGLTGAGSAYLEAVRKDMGLPLSEAEFLHIRNVLRHLRRDPTTDELYFAAAYANGSKKLPDAVRVASVTSEDRSLVKAYARFFDEFNSHRPPAGRQTPASLISLARYACHPRGDENFVFRICELNGEAETGPENGFLTPMPDTGSITVSISDPPKPRPGDALFFLSAGGAADAPYRIRGAVALLVRSGALPVLCPLSNKGLIFALSDICDGATADATALPGNGHAEALCLPYPGCAVIAVSPDFLSDAVTAFRTCGINAARLGTVGGSDFRILSVSPDGGTPTASVNLPAELLYRLRFYRNANMRADTADETKDESDAFRITMKYYDPNPMIESTPPHRGVLLCGALLRNVRTPGHVSEAFGKLTDSFRQQNIPLDGIKYAVNGMLATDDGSAIPLILALDTFIKTTGATVSAADFTLTRTGSGAAIMAYTHA